MVVLPLIFFLIHVIVFAMLGGWVAGQKNRDRTEGRLLRGILGIIGVIIEALLPSKA